MLKFYMMVMAAMMLGVTVAKFNEPDWGFQSYLDEDFTLVCNHSTLIVNPFNFIRWKLPSGQMLSKSTEKYVLNSRMTVVNMDLAIQNVTESDAGVYVCYVYENNQMTQERGHLLRGLNIGGHKYKPLFDKYRYNLMVAGLAALILFVPLVTACLVYKFRFQTPEQKQKKRDARLEATKHQRHLASNGKDAELSEVAVRDGKGADNVAYDNASDEMGTRL